LTVPFTVAPVDVTAVAALVVATAEPAPKALPASRNVAGAETARPHRMIVILRILLSFDRVRPCIVLTLLL
jgi:hypothetical protein